MSNERMNEQANIQFPQSKHTWFLFSPSPCRQHPQQQTVCVFGLCTLNDRLNFYYDVFIFLSSRDRKNEEIYIIQFLFAVLSLLKWVFHFIRKRESDVFSHSFPKNYTICRLSSINLMWKTVDVYREWRRVREELEAKGDEEKIVHKKL